MVSENDFEMRTLLFIPFALLLLAACATAKKTTKTTGTITRIVHGTSFGHCRGYCIHEITYTGNQIIYTERSRDTASFPVKELVQSLSADKFNELTTSVTWDNWTTNDSIIGCPDCTDRGAEYIIITTEKGTKRIMFDAHETPPGLEKILSVIRYDRRVMERSLNAEKEE